ncbi:MAG: TolC family protein [Geobacter sp.]|nr:MAG: TolC family protein [Geobacter sp.]
MNRILRVIATGLLIPAAFAQAETLTLKTCLTAARQSNNTLKVAAYDQRIAAEGERIARSGYLPRVDLQGGYTAQFDPQSIDLGGGRTVATQDADYAFAGLGIYQTLYDFGRTDARSGHARAMREAAEFTYSGYEQDVFLQVVTSYFGILQAQKLMQSAEDEVVQMTDHLRVAQNLYEQGVVTRNDLLQAEVRLAGSQQYRLASANRLDNAWLQLNYLMDRKPDFRADLDESAGLPTPPATDSGELSLANRAEIKALEKAVEGSEFDIQESKGGYYPEVYAKAGMDYLQNSHVKEQTILGATVGLRINLFDGLATTGRYRQAVATRSKNEEALRQLKAIIELEYRTAVNDARVAFERIKVAETSIRQGEENLRINKDRYQAQVGTATDVIDAQTLLTQTRTDYYRSMFDYQIAFARVKKALGEL